MLSKEFAEKLTEAFKDVNDRLAALEHSVNDVLIKGLEDASNEYDDDVAFSEFSDKYKDKFDSVAEPVKVLYGEDFDLPSSIYEQLKEIEKTEDYDEAAQVDAIIEEIDSKIKALQDLKKEVVKEEETVEESTEEEPAEDEDEIPSEEQLAKEFDEYAHSN